MPVVTGGGLAVRTALHADDAVDALKTADNATDATRSVTNGRCSFTPDTPVATPDGAVPIAAIEVGDTVFAYNETTCATGVYTVTATWGYLDLVIVALTLANETLTATPENLFCPPLTGGKGILFVRHPTHPPSTVRPQGVVALPSLQTRPAQYC
ncbi:MAG: hypothetical protein MI924_14350 [Chloroflexales bacterium]|nr:hypothetical protein [Chloroflexales bacterium]